MSHESFQLPLITVHDFLQFYNAHGTTSGEGVSALTEVQNGSQENKDLISTNLNSEIIDPRMNSNPTPNLRDKISTIIANQQFSNNNNSDSIPLRNNEPSLNDKEDKIQASDFNSNASTRNTSRNEDNTRRRRNSKKQYENASHYRDKNEYIQLDSTKKFTNTLNNETEVNDLKNNPLSTSLNQNEEKQNNSSKKQNRKWNLGLELENAFKYSYPDFDFGFLIQYNSFDKDLSTKKNSNYNLVEAQNILNYEAYNDSKDKLIKEDEEVKNEFSAISEDLQSDLQLDINSRIVQNEDHNNLEDKDANNISLSDKMRVQLRTNIINAFRNKRKIMARRFDVYTSPVYKAFKESKEEDELLDFELNKQEDSNKQENIQQVVHKEFKYKFFKNLFFRHEKPRIDQLNNENIKLGHETSILSNTNNKGLVNKSDNFSTGNLSNEDQKSISRRERMKNYFHEKISNLKNINRINPSRLIPTTYSYMPFVSMCIGSHSQEDLNQFVIQIASQLNIEMIAILHMKNVKKLWGKSGSLMPIVKQFNGQKGILILDNIHQAKPNVIFMLLKLWTKGVIRRQLKASNFKARKRKISFREKNDKEYDVIIDVRNIIFILNTNVLSSTEICRLLDPSMDIFSNQLSLERTVEKIVSHYYSFEDRNQFDSNSTNINSLQSIDDVIKDIRSRVNDKLVDKFKMQHVGVTSFDRVNIIIPFLPSSYSLITEHVYEYITRKLNYYNQLFLYFKDTSFSWDKQVEKWIFNKAFRHYNLGQSKDEPQEENAKLFKKIRKISHFVILNNILIEELSFEQLKRVIGNSPQARWKRLVNYLARVNQQASIGDIKSFSKLISSKSIRIHVRLRVDEADMLVREVSQFIEEGAIRKTLSTAASIISRRTQKNSFFQRFRSKL